MHLRAEPGASVAVNGAPPTDTPLVSDRDGKPDVVTVGRVRLTVIERGGRLAVRARDPESPRRTTFAGLEYFPVDPALRVEATFEPYEALRAIDVPSAQGPPQKAFAPGLVRFTIAGVEHALEPTVESPADDTLFFVFSDATAGTETYGAGRFLYAPRSRTPGRHGSSSTSTSPRTRPAPSPPTPPARFPCRRTSCR